MEQAKERPRRRADERGLGANQQCLAMLANTSTRHPPPAHHLRYSNAGRQPGRPDLIIFFPAYAETCFKK